MMQKTSVFILLLTSFGVFASDAELPTPESDVQIKSNQWRYNNELKNENMSQTVQIPYGNKVNIEARQINDNRTEEQRIIDDAVTEAGTGGWGEDDIIRERLNVEKRLRSKSELLTPLKANQNVQTLDLSPSAEPIIINTRENFNTILSFIDSVGNPWPVLWSLPGNSAYAEISYDAKDESSSQHIIVLKATKKYQVTNYTVALKGLDEPIVFILQNTLDGPTDFKLVFKVPKIGPKTDLSAYSSGTGVGNKVSQHNIEDISINELDRFYAVEPTDAQRIPTSQPEIASVWFYKNQFVVKTRFEMVAAYKTIAYGAGDWRVYVLNKPEYELMFITESGVVRVGMPVDVVHNFSTQLSNK